MGLSLGIAILRYRLFDIDLIIRRTLVYAVLTALLAAVYFTSVAAIQFAFRAVTQGTSPAAVVISTLGIAALFNPLRRKIQEIIDRRFYRSRYNAEHTLAIFARTIRDQMDIDEVSHQLVKVSQETMQPASVSLWVKPAGKSIMVTGLMYRLPPPPGKLFDVGGYRLHLHIQGQGSPAAIMDSGLIGNSLLWSNVIPAVARLTQACAFDRAGYAWSDPAPPHVPRTSAQIVAELRAALRAAGVEPPYILIGHSLGGINMLVYAYTHPSEVAGLVMVDPSHPEMFERVKGLPGPKAMEFNSLLMSALARAGLFRPLAKRLTKMLLPDGERTLPKEAWTALVALAAQPGTYQTAHREARGAVQSLAQARGKPGSLGNLPLEILTADWWVTGKPSPLKTSSTQLRGEMAALSTRGRHLTVSGCDHTSLPVVRPDAVADAVGRILALQG
jgi:pimeloyl-ACP methyl ester carboxylesterase